MTEAQRKRAEELFRVIRDSPAEQYASLLDDACLDDNEVRREVESLLKSYNQAASFMESPAARIGGDTSKLAGDLTNTPTDAIPGYRILKELHRGGQGVVYQAIQESTKRKVALKAMLEGPFSSASSRRRFEREIELVGSLSHPGIVAIYDSGVASGKFFFAMEYIRGKSLTQFVQSRKLGVDDTLRLLIRICDAVDYAHQKGVIHRDLKPSNILVDERGNPRVVDFGLAKVGGTEAEMANSQLVSVTGQVMGTLAYMSPEQAAGQPDQVDMRSDVYSLGVIAYELLTAELPYDVSGQMSDALTAIQHAEPRRPKSIHGRINDEVDTIVIKALAKDPQRRYPTAGTFGADMQRFLDGDPIEAKRDSVAYIAKRILRRYRFPAAIACAFAIVVCGSLVASLTFWQRAVDDRDLAVADRAALKIAQIASENEATNARTAEQKARAATEVVVEAREAQRRELYASHIQDMRQAYSGGATDRIQKLLKEYVPIEGQTDLRGWEWYYWWWASRRQVRQLTNEWGGFMGMAVSPDKNWFAVKTHPAAVFIHFAPSQAMITDIQNVAPWREFRTEIAISPDGQYFVAICEDSQGIDSTIKLWSTVEPYPELPALQHKHDLVAITFSSTGMLAAADETGRVTFWNVENQTQLGAPLETGQTLRCIAFSPDGVRLATGDAGNDEAPSLLVWKLATRDIDVQLVDKQHDVRALVWESRGDHDVVAAGFANGFVRLWDTDGETYKAGDWLPTGGPVLSLAFSPDGGRIAASTSQNNSVHVWETDSARLINTAKGHSQRIWGVAFADEGSTVLSCSEDGTLKTWDVSHCGAFDRLTSAPLEVVRGNRSLIFGADGQSLWYGGMSRGNEGLARPVCLWNLASDGSPQEFAAKPNERVAISANGLFQVAFTQESDAEYRLQVRRIDAADPKLLRDLLIPNENVHGPPTEMAVSDDGAVVAWSRDNQLVLVNIKNGRHTTWTGNWKGRLITLSHDGAMLAAVEGEKTRLWDVADDVRALLPKSTFSGQSLVFDVEFSPDGRHLATAGWNSKKQIQLIDAERGELIANLCGHAGRVNCVCFSRDGRHLVSGGMDATVRLWGVEQQSLRLTLPSHDRPVTAVAISPDGQTIVSMSDEGDTRLWRGGTEDMQDASYWVWLAETHEEK